MFEIEPVAENDSIQRSVNHFYSYFRGKVVEYPDVVIPFEPINRYSGVGKGCNGGKKTHEPTWDHLALFNM